MDVYRRRRIVALSVLAGLVLGIVLATGGSDSKPKAEAASKPKAAPKPKPPAAQSEPDTQAKPAARAKAAKEEAE